MGINEINDSLFHPCNDSPTILNKPPFGTCLYGSTMFKYPGGYVGSEWSEFTQFDYIEKYYKHGISFTLNKNSKIIAIDTLDDYRRILRMYKRIDESGINNQIDFYELSKTYDAFHLTRKAFHRMRLPLGMNKEEYDFFYKERNANFYAYDAETWILFNLDCINRGSILNHNNIMYSG